MFSPIKSKQQRNDTVYNIYLVLFIYIPNRKYFRIYLFPQVSILLSTLHFLYKKSGNTLPTLRAFFCNLCKCIALIRLQFACLWNIGGLVYSVSFIEKLNLFIIMAILHFLSVLWGFFHIVWLDLNHILQGPRVLSFLYLYVY